MHPRTPSYVNIIIDYFQTTIEAYRCDNSISISQQTIRNNQASWGDIFEFFCLARTTGAVHKSLNAQNAKLYFNFVLQVAGNHV